MKRVGVMTKKKKWAIYWSLASPLSGFSYYPCYIFILVCSYKVSCLGDGVLLGSMYYIACAAEDRPAMKATISSLSALGERGHLW